MRVIFDSNVFDDIIAGRLDVSVLIRKRVKIQKWYADRGKRVKIYITHIQKDELAACRNEQRRTQLLQCMASIGVHTLPTESFCIGVSRIGEARISDGSDLIRKLEGGNPVHIQDALIGETAIKNALTVITNDDRFKKRIAAQGGQALTTEEFLKVLKEPDA